MYLKIVVGDMKVSTRLLEVDEVKVEHLMVKEFKKRTPEDGEDPRLQYYGNIPIQYCGPIDSVENTETITLTYIKPKVGDEFLVVDLDSTPFFRVYVMNDNGKTIEKV